MLGTTSEMQLAHILHIISTHTHAHTHTHTHTSNDTDVHAHMNCTLARMTSFYISCVAY
jgi:hypothetical protein